MWVPGFSTLDLNPSYLSAAEESFSSITYSNFLRALVPVSNIEILVSTAGTGKYLKSEFEQY